MKLPKALKIMGKEYKVVEHLGAYKDNLSQVLGSGAGNLGSTSNSMCRIVVASNQSKEQMKDTLIHEAIHAYDYALQLGLDEEQVHRLAACTLSLLADNPALVKYLVS